jgi:ABC-2 type transport system permease protein
MRVFLAAAYYGSRGYFAWMPPSIYVAQKLLVPLGQLALFSLIGSYGGSQPLDFYLVGNAILIASAACIWLSVALAEERILGTLQLVSAAPANTIAVFTGRTVVQVVESLGHVAIAFAWAVAVFGLALPASSIGSIFIIVVVGTAACAGVGLLLGALSMVWLDQNLASNAVVFALLVLSGANIPRDELPPVLYDIGSLLPLTRSIDAARTVVSGGSLADALPAIAGELAVAAVYATLGFAIYRYLEVQARRRGTLEGF